MNDNDYFEPKSVTTSDWNMYLCEWIHIFQATDTEHDPRNEIWNGHNYTLIVILLAYISIYSSWKNMKPKTKHMLVSYTEWETVATASISTSQYQFPWLRIGLINLSSAALFIFGKWCYHLVQIFVNGKINWTFLFPLLQHIPLCLMYVSMICSSAMTSPKLCHSFGNALSEAPYWRIFHFWGNFQSDTPYIQKHLVVQKLQ